MSSAATVSVKPIIRGIGGGACLGAGVALGAYSGGWFLLVAVLPTLIGFGLVAGAIERSRTTVARGEPVEVRVDLIDRSAPRLMASSTLIAGEAFPRGDAPFRFQTNARLSTGHLADLVGNGYGSLPSDALGEPGSAPITEHRVSATQIPTVLAAVAAMWATILVPSGDFWNFKLLTAQSQSAIPATTSEVDTGPPASIPPLSLGYEIRR
ncbi:hypothetical protein [Mycobacteroides franklinii]|uniref:Uncharacterized protein n=1 Tax=Mycobacteroides franklinii TaxID=948102 RepID=A0A4V6PJW2_9MYCO|nr:hypothetical protein [Mycobacteroides franklinii]TDH20128.1 hypothetical protein EJ571_15115 [Mycobacteroides franklinii]